MAAGETKEMSGVQLAPICQAQMPGLPAANMAATKGVWQRVVSELSRRDTFEHLGRKALAIRVIGTLFVDGT
jgi:hypothetical protein